MLEPALLATLTAQPSHGYDLRKEVEALSGGLVCLDPGGMYRILRRLEDDGYIVSNWLGGDHGPQRRRYELTDDGRLLLNDWVDNLRQRERALKSVIEMAERSLEPPTGNAMENREARNTDDRD